MCVIKYNTIYNIKRLSTFYLHHLVTEVDQKPFEPSRDEIKFNSILSVYRF